MSFKKEISEMLEKHPNLTEEDIMILKRLNGMLHNNKSLEKKLKSLMHDIKHIRDKGDNA